MKHAWHVVLLVVVFIFLLKCDCVNGGAVFNVLQPVVVIIGNILDNLMKNIRVEIDPRSTLTATELIKYYGYPAEEHNVLTQDGYILTLHRIPHSKNGRNRNGTRIPFYLNHCLLCSSTIFYLFGPTNSLAFQLADAGFDVWMGNFRGTTWSRNHQHLSTNSSAFWDFSWHEMGIFDVPAMIDYVLDYTRHPKLFFAGYSQGTTTFYVMASRLPQYNDKIIAHFSLSPVGIFKHNKKRMWLPTMLEIIVRGVWKVFGYYEFFPNRMYMKKLTHLACSVNSPTHKLCARILYFVAGYAKDEFDNTLLAYAMAQTLHGSSIKQIMHYAQILNSGEFREYDERIIPCNYLGFPKPKEYDLKRITTPTYLLIGDGDVYGTDEDYSELYNTIKNPKGLIKVPVKGWGHVDFVMGKHTPKFINNVILALTKLYLVP